LTGSYEGVRPARMDRLFKVCMCRGGLCTALAQRPSRGKHKAMICVKGGVLPSAGPLCKCGVVVSSAHTDLGMIIHMNGSHPTVTGPGNLPRLQTRADPQCPTLPRMPSSRAVRKRPIRGLKERMKTGALLGYQSTGAHGKLIVKN